MTGRHAAPPDDAFDQQERDRLGAHRADVEVPLGPADAAPAAPGKKRATATEAAPATPAPAASTPKRASKS
jgi:hypothetical protein